MHEDDQYFFEMLAAGASGYVPKSAAPNDLISAVYAVRNGGVFLFPSVARALVSDYLQRVEQNGEPGRPFDNLTDREREVLTAILLHGSDNYTRGVAPYKERRPRRSDERKETGPGDRARAGLVFEVCGASTAN